jgi:histidine triad (HIT) family protein
VEAVYEDDEFIAFPDVHPQAPVHALIIPKAHFATLADITDDGLMGRAFLAACEVARRLGVDQEGFRTVVNTRDNGGQTVYHVHIHVLGGRFLSWPPG